LLTYAKIPVIICDNTALPFPDLTIDVVVTNGAPIDRGDTWLGPSIPSAEIKRVLRPGCVWYDNGLQAFTK
jgi:hypothetical protein